MTPMPPAIAERPNAAENPQPPHARPGDDAQRNAQMESQDQQREAIDMQVVEDGDTPNR
jgi:hypothetical protein